MAVVVVVVEAAGLASFSFLGAAALAGADLFASFTVPEAPFGRRNSPAFSPARSALLMCELTCASLVAPSLLFALMYLVTA